MYFVLDTNTRCTNLFDTCCTQNTWMLSLTPMSTDTQPVIFGCAAAPPAPLRDVVSPPPLPLALKL